MVSIRYANNYASLLMKQRENDNNKVYWKNIWVKVIYQHGLRGMIWKREHTLCEQTLQKHSWSKRNLISFCDVLLKVSQGKILAMCNISIKRNYHELLQLIYMYILHIFINIKQLRRQISENLVFYENLYYWEQINKAFLFADDSRRRMK